MKTEKHIIKLPTRTGCCEVTELSDRIEVRLSFSKYGFFDDLVEVSRWLKPIFEAYENDPRPVQTWNPHSGEKATIAGDGSFAIIERPA